MTSAANLARRLLDPILSPLARLQAQRPGILLLVVAVITALTGAEALKLRVLTGFESLLPESKPSVQELKRVSKLTSGVTTLFIIVEGGPTTPVSALRQAGDAIVPALKALGPPYVGHAEDGVHDALTFLQPRAGLFLTLPKLEELRDDIEKQYAKAVGSATGLYVDLLDEGGEGGGEAKQKMDLESIRSKLSMGGADPNRYPGGYYQSKDGKALVVLVASKVSANDFDKSAETLAQIKKVVDSVNVQRFDPGITVDYSGEMKTAQSEYRAVLKDLTDVGVVGAVLIAGIVMLYYLRLRVLAIMVLTIVIGLSWTFGATQLTIGRLNLATGFLFTIVAGNGINFGIIYMARYLECRRREMSLADSLSEATRETWLPTLTAALAAAASYGSLSATDFRGFHDFGFIGGMGMVLCWSSTYIALPALLAFFERLLPLGVGGPLAGIRKAMRGGGVAFGRPFEYLVERAPRAITVVGLALSAAGFIAGIFWIRANPMEYDLRKIRTDESERANEVRLNTLGDDITGYPGAKGMAILVDRTDQVPQLKAILDARRDAVPVELKPFERLFSLQDFVPDQQAQKIPIVLKLRQRLLRAHRQGAFTEEDWKQLEPMLPPAELAEFGTEALPKDITQMFTEADGTVGRIVYIAPAANASTEDAHYLFRWADSYRETKLPDNSVIRGSGRAVIYADMWTSVVEDVPYAVLLSFGATVLTVIIAFRAGKAVFLVLASLLIGVMWMVGLLVVSGVRLNFLNFIALPITFGIGVDYAVNVVQRYVREGRGSALLAIRETGGAVILCSLTTTLGYLALVRSTNFGVRSLGVAAFIGEVSCLLASVLVLPAALCWMDSKSKQKSGHGSQEHAQQPVEKEA